MEPALQGKLTSEERRRELGENDFPVEQHLQETFESTVDEGAEPLHRTFRAVVITGLFRGRCTAEATLSGNFCAVTATETVAELY